MNRLPQSILVALALLACLLVRGTLAAEGDTQGWIVFSGWDGDDYEIFIVQADGSDLHPLTDNDVPDQYPRWSPDGSRIAYLTVSNEGKYVFRVLDVAGGTTSAPLGDQPLDDYIPSWSPDGSRVVVSDLGTAYIINLDSGETVTVGEHGDGYAQPHWSPDGSLIALERAWRTPEEQTVLMSPDGELVQAFSIVDTELEGFVIEKRWSPDNSQLLVAWVEAQGGRAKQIPIELVDVASGTGKTLLRDHNYRIPVWSPEGALFAYGIEIPIPGSVEYHMMQYDLATGESRPLADTEGFNYFPATWSPDGAYLLALMHPTDAPVQTQLQILDRDGVLVRILTDIEVHHSWNPGIDWIAPSPP